jgi:hypothetical protein
MVINNALKNQKDVKNFINQAPSGLSKIVFFVGNMCSIVKIAAIAQSGELSFPVSKS